MALSAGDILVYDGTNWVNSGYTKVILSPAPSATADYGLLNLGDGGFGGGAPSFVGSSGGTVIAANPASGFNGRFIDCQIAGVRFFSVDASGQTNLLFRDTATDTTPSPFRMEHYSSNPAQAGFGVGFQFYLVDATTSGSGGPLEYEAGDIQAVTSTANVGISGSEAYLVFRTKQIGTVTPQEALRLEGSGTARFSGAVQGRLVPFRLSRTSITMSADANQTLTSQQYQNAIIEMAGGTALTAQRNIVVPITAGSFWIVYNNTSGGQALQFIGASGTGIVVATGKRAILYADGTNIVRVTADT